MDVDLERLRSIGEAIQDGVDVLNAVSVIERYEKAMVSLAEMIEEYEYLADISRDEQLLVACKCKADGIRIAIDVIDRTLKEKALAALCDAMAGKDGGK